MARRMLHGIGTLIDGVLGVNPSWRDGVDAHLSCQTDCQRMGQGGNATLGGRVALGLRLAHTVAGGGDVDDGGTLGKVRGEKLGEDSSSGPAHHQIGVLKKCCKTTCY